MGDWFKDWFASDEYTEVYRHRDNEDAKNLFELILTNVPVHPGSTVFDIACGAGRHSLLFAVRHCKVTGFDLSLNLLRTAKRQADASGLKLNLFNADLRSLCVKGKFDIIVNLFTSFGYFESDEDNFLLFRNAGRLLNNGGYFIFDFFNEVHLRNALVPVSSERIAGKEVIQKRRIVNDRINKEIIIKDGETERTYFESVRLYNHNQIILQFEKEGFFIQKIFGDYDGKEFNSGLSPRIIIIARR
ncbi:MAG: class I SAM-dependent methyltransferase [Ignavibacteria bacterium]